MGDTLSLGIAKWTVNLALGSEKSRFSALLLKRICEVVI